MSRSLDLLTDACAGLPTTVKKMFGGHGLFAPNGGMFAGIVTDDEIIFKLQLGPQRDELIAIGGKPWVYQGRDKPMTMQEWIVVPQGFYDDPDALRGWAARAHGAAPGKALSTKPPRRVPIAEVRRLRKAPRAKGKARQSRR